ncbi:hypothetical protein F5Y01DRAFT_322287 [Xylaria sp. FL0043]|nr:hypothetical protein F5Y01DRAFT_322287 [Xylaria sp. FL0043]
MGRIYSSAISVYAWLGPAADQSDEVIDLLHRLHDHNLLNMEGRNEVVAQFYEHGLAESLFELCGRPYWRRIWIVQEVALARDVIFHCGTRKIACSILDGVCSGWPLQTSGDSAWRHWSILKDRFMDIGADCTGRPLMRLPVSTISWLNVKRGTPVAGHEGQGLLVERPFEIRGECEMGPHVTFSRTVDSPAWSLEVITFGNLEYMGKYGLLKVDPDDKRNLIIENTEGHATFVKGKALSFNPERFQAKTAYTTILIFWSGLHQTLAGTVLHARSEQTSRKLAELIAQYEHWQCSDARDHVYAILSMATDYQRAFLSHDIKLLQLRPDYTWSRVRLFFETVRFCKDEQNAIALGRILTKVLDIGMEACREDEDTLVEQLASCILKQDLALTVSVVVKKSDFLLSDLQPRRIKTSIDHLAYVYALASSQWTGPNCKLKSILLYDHMDEIYVRVAEPPYYVIPDKLCILSEEPAAFDVIFHLDSAELFLVARPTSNEGIYTCIGVGGTPEAYNSARWSPRLRSSLANLFWWLSQTPINVSQPSVKVPNYYAEVSYPLYYLLLDSSTADSYFMRANVTLPFSHTGLGWKRRLHRRTLREGCLKPQKGIRIFGQTIWDRFWSGESTEAGDGSRVIGADIFGAEFRVRSDYEWDHSIPYELVAFGPLYPEF